MLCFHNSDFIFSAVLEKVIAELKQILKRDFNKKMIENTAFKTFENWWDECENKHKVIFCFSLNFDGKSEIVNKEYSGGRWVIPQYGGNPPVWCTGLSVYYSPQAVFTKLAGHKPPQGNSNGCQAFRYLARSVLVVLSQGKLCHNIPEEIALLKGEEYSAASLHSFTTCQQMAIARILSSAGMKGRWKWEIPEKNCRPITLSCTIPSWGKSGMTRPGIEPGSPWWEVSRLTTQQPWPPS
ncbi:hypothetical protein PR048_032686 [Dryococelus australis]|uniref:Uncharacterized protein n=1 Tax=Dryococelus australis TaxID=614101 RepID=A0ABQ9G2X5_9NEOP|nr:hypothetical protein PR048_032686 [Dryococelus australis]